MEPPIFLTVLLLLAKGYEIVAQRVDFVTTSCSPSPTLCATSYLQPTGQCNTIPAVIRPIIAEPAPVPNVPTYQDYGNYNFAPPVMPMPPVIIARDSDDDWYNLMYFLIFALSNNKGGGCNNCYPNGGYGGYCGCGNCGGGCGCGGYGCGGYGCNGCGGYGCGGVRPYDSAANSGGSATNSGGSDANSGGSDANSGGSDANGGGSTNSGGSDSSLGSDVIYVPYPIAIPMNCPYNYPDILPSIPDFYPPYPGPSPPLPPLPPQLPPCECDCRDEISFIIRTNCDSK